VLKSAKERLDLDTFNSLPIQWSSILLGFQTKTIRDKRSNSAVAIIKRYRDNVYNIYLPREMWRVRYG